MGRDKDLFWQLLDGERLLELAGRLQVELLGHPECAPVDAEGAAAAYVLVDLERLQRVRVDVVHVPARVVGADGDGGHVERTQATTDLRERLRFVGGVAREPETGRKALLLPYTVQ